MEPLKYKFNKDGETEPETPDATPEDKVELGDTYRTHGDARSLCFTLLNGEEISLYYSDLVEVRYTPEESTIMLTYTRCTVTLKGHNLRELSRRIRFQQQMEIICTDKRYERLKDEDYLEVIMEISINFSL